MEGFNLKKAGFGLIVVSLFLISTCSVVITANGGTNVFYAGDFPNYRDINDVNHKNVPDSSNDWDYPNAFVRFPNSQNFDKYCGIRFRNNDGEFLIPDEYNLPESSGYLKWYMSEDIHFQSFVPDCNRIGAFGIRFSALGEDTYTFFKVGMYKEEWVKTNKIENGRFVWEKRPDTSNPIWGPRLYGSSDAGTIDSLFGTGKMNGWVGQLYKKPYGRNYLVRNLDGFYYFEENGNSNYASIGVTPGETYYIGVQLLEDLSRDSCKNGYGWHSTGDLYEKGCRSKLDTSFPPVRDCEDSRGYKVYEDKDFCFGVWGWNLAPEQPTNNYPAHEESVELIEYNSGQSGNGNIVSSVSQYDGKIGTYLSVDVSDLDIHDEYLEVLFYGACDPYNEYKNAIDLVKEENLIGRTGVSKFQRDICYPNPVSRRIFWPDLLVSGEIPYKWTVVVRDWGLQRAGAYSGEGQHGAECVASKPWEFYTLPHENDDECEPAIQIVKKAEPDIINSGEEVTYTYEITNIGNCDLSNVVVTDDKLGDINKIINRCDNDDILNLGETWIYEKSTILYESTYNTGTVTAYDENEQYVEASDTFYVEVRNVQTDVCIEKVVKRYSEKCWEDYLEVNINEKVTFKLIVENKGENPVDLIVEDVLPANLKYIPIDVLPTEPIEDGKILSWYFEDIQPNQPFDIIFSAEAIDYGTGENIATVTTLDQSSEDSDSAVVEVICVQEEEDDDESEEDDLAEVKITKPTDKSIYLDNKNNGYFPFTVVIRAIDIEASIIDPDGSIEEVKFFIDDELKHTATSSPYKWTCNEKYIGRYLIKIIAYDKAGSEVASDEIKILAFIF